MWPVYDVFGLVDGFGQIIVGCRLPGLTTFPANDFYPPPAGCLFGGHPKALVFKLRHYSPSKAP